MTKLFHDCFFCHLLATFDPLFHFLKYADDRLTSHQIGREQIARVASTSVFYLLKSDQSEECNSSLFSCLTFSNICLHLQRKVLHLHRFNVHFLNIRKMTVRLVWMQLPTFYVQFTLKPIHIAHDWKCLISQVQLSGCPSLQSVIRSSQPFNSQVVFFAVPGWVVLTWMTRTSGSARQESGTTQ